MHPLAFLSARKTSTRTHPSSSTPFRNSEYNSLEAELGANAVQRTLGNRIVTASVAGDDSSRDDDSRANNSQVSRSFTAILRRKSPELARAAMGECDPFFRDSLNKAEPKRASNGVSTPRLLPGIARLEVPANSTIRRSIHESKLQTKDPMYVGEETSSRKHIMEILAARGVKSLESARGDQRALAELTLTRSGWEKQDIVDFLDHDKEPRVKYLQGDEMEAYRLNLGGRITQGPEDAEKKPPYDTTDSMVVGTGSGYAIFVMDKDRKFYAGSHKSGLFHHSSLVGGGKVASAGAIKVEQGGMTEITNQSGHYKPDGRALARAGKALESGGVNMANVKVRTVKPGTVKLDDRGTYPAFKQEEDEKKVQYKKSLMLDNILDDESSESEDEQEIETTSESTTTATTSGALGEAEESEAEEQTTSFGGGGENDYSALLEGEGL